MKDINKRSNKKSNKTLEIKESEIDKEFNESLIKLQKTQIFQVKLLILTGFTIFIAGLILIYFSQIWIKDKTSLEEITKKYNTLLESSSTTDESTQLMEEVGKIIILPDEKPSIITVLDKEALSDQDFFKNAENGDKVLVFTENKKAILYRPSTKVIIEVAPLFIDESISE